MHCTGLAEFLFLFNHPAAILKNFTFPDISVLFFIKILDYCTRFHQKLREVTYLNYIDHIDISFDMNPSSLTLLGIPCFCLYVIQWEFINAVLLRS